MKLIQHQFFHGPSPWFPYSGLYVRCSPHSGGKFAAMIRGSPLERLKAIHENLLYAAPVIAESSLFSDWRSWSETDQGEADWFLAIAEVMARDFCWSPRSGQQLSSNGDSADLFVPCNDESVGLACIRFSASVVGALPMLVKDQGHAWVEKLAEGYQQTRQQCRRVGLNQSAIALARAAHQRGIPVARPIAPGQYVHLGQGIHLQEIFETCTSKTSAVARNLSADKYLSSQILQRFQLPTAQTVAVNSMEEATKAAKMLGYPLVVKPRSASKGQGVTVDIRTATSFQKAIQHALSFQKGLVVERFVAGDDHRLLVVAGRLVAAAKRTPAHIVGDGKSSVRQLIEITNRDPQRGMPFERLREKILLDDEALAFLSRAGLTPESVPKRDQAVYLRGAANISRGGSSIDMTDHVHPDNRQIAEMAARLIGLDVTGIDFLTPDIRKSWREVDSAILEVNATPGLRPHLGANPKRDVCTPIIEHLFPNGGNGRVPSVGVTGSLGKTSTCRLISAVLERAGHVVALSGTQGMFIGNHALKAGDHAGGRAALSLLRDRSVTASVAEIARGGLIKKGLGFDCLDVGVVLNVHDNHLGLNGVNSREQMARVKRLVVEHAKKLAVLNADDPLCLAMQTQTKARHLALTSLTANNTAINAHRMRGSLCAYLSEDHQLRWESQGQMLAQLALVDLADARGGSFRPAVQHALVAGCVAHILDIDFSITLSVLKSYRSTVATNPGRTNHLTGLPYQLVLSHADGPQAIRALVEYAAALKASGERRLLICSAGDRPDSFIKGMGREAAGYFSKYICCDYSELRGRKEAEAANIIANSLMESGVPREKIFVMPSLYQAIEFAYRNLQAEDLLVENTYHGKIDETWLRLRGLSRLPQYHLADE